MPEPIPCDNPAPDGPGSPPRWTQGDKDMVGTAYSADSPLWFTFSRGIVNELYYPTVDRPQIRDLQYLVTDGESFLIEERHMETELEYGEPNVLEVRVVNRDPEGRFQIVKHIIGAPHEATLLVHTYFEPAEEWRDRLKLYMLCAPHMEGGGWGNSGAALTVSERTILTAHKGDIWLALSTSNGLTRTSYGYVGVNDGWQDLHDNYQLDWNYDCARDGNIALTGEVDLSSGYEFVLALSFGEGRHNALSALFQSLSLPFAEQRQNYAEQWKRSCHNIARLGKVSGDAGRLYNRSQSVLLAHEDKRFAGAVIASLSIPWGTIKGDEGGSGGYHLVWTRDLVQSATGLLATDNADTARRALIYLASAQTESGGFYQNFWVNGEPHLRGIQLDEVAFPILLAWRLRSMDALKFFDPLPMVRAATGFLIRNGPVTPQERWEEVSGFSPSTLASNIAALTCAAGFLRADGDEQTAQFVQQYADFLESHVEAWTVTTEGTLVPEIPRHYIRINPADPDDPHPNENPNEGTVYITNRHPDARKEFPAKEIVDAGFLELVRFGVRKAGDPLIEDSLRVVDAVLKIETPMGPVWRRYNHDGYGQQPDGSPFDGWGVGRGWPLLTGERAHYELAAGHDVKHFIKTLEGFASPSGLLPEQVWDEEERPQPWLYLGGPTGSAMPLCWAHAEYIKLLRSTADGHIFDHIPEVVERYQSGNERQQFEIWKPNRQVRTVPGGWTLRIQRPQPFHLRWSADDWESSDEIEATGTALGIFFADLPAPSEDAAQKRAFSFTFYYPEEDSWEGQKYRVIIEDV